MKPDLARLQETLGKGKSVIGLHIGSFSVNVAQIARHNGRPVLIKTAIEPIDLKKEDSRDRAVLKSLKTALAKFSCRKAMISCVIQDPQIVVRKIVTPPMPSEEIDSAVRLALKGLVQFSLEEAVWDFQRTDQAPQKGMERFNILAAACPRRIIDQMQTAFRSLGVKVSSYIPLSVGFENLMGKSGSDGILAVIEMGGQLSELNIYRNGRLEFSNKLSVAGGDITQSMTGALFSDSGKTELTLEEAEAIKKEYGIPQPDDNRAINDKVTTQHIFSLIKPKITQLASEINRVFDYYREKLHGRGVDRIILFGGASQLKGLDGFLSAELGLEVKRGHPLQGIELLDPSVVSQDDAQRLVSALGAALGDFKGINLLPKKSPGQTKRLIKTHGMKTAALVMAAAVGLMYLSLDRQIGIQSKELSSQERQLSQKLKDIRQGLSIRQLTDQRPSWGKILKLFSRMPANIYLNELILKDGQLHMKGIAQGEDPEPGLSGLIVSLQHNIFKDVRLISRRKIAGEDQQYEFEITANTSKVSDGFKDH